MFRPVSFQEARAVLISGTYVTCVGVLFLFLVSIPFLISGYLFWTLTRNIFLSILFGLLIEALALIYPVAIYNLCVTRE